MEFISYTISDLSVSLKTGKTPKTSNPEYFEGDVIWITPSDLKGQKYADSSERTLTSVAVEKNEAHLYKEGTVLISTIGNIGKAALVSDPVSANQQITGISVKTNIILPELFYYWLILNKKILENKANKAVISQLNNKLLRKITVSFPRNLKDQQNFVSYLNNIQSIIDKRIQTIAIIDKLKKNLFLELFLENKENNEWSNLTLTESKGVKNTTYGTAVKSNDEGNGFPIVRMNNISYEGNISLEDIKHVVISDQDFKKYELKDRDILFNRTNSPDLVGKIAIWNNGPGFSYAGYLIKIELDEKVFNPYYFSAFFNSDFGKEVLRNKSRLSGNQANISATTFMKQKILIAPIDLQLTFEKHLKKLEALKTQFESSLDLLETIFQSALQKTFTEDVAINEDLFFEEILPNLSLEEVKDQKRLEILIDWMDKNKSRFTNFDSYNNAYEVVVKLLDGGILEQHIKDDKIILKRTK